VHATASEGADGTTGFQSGEEHDLRSFKKMLLGAVTTMVLAAGLAVSPASATVPSKGRLTQEANVPYLAWRGEHVRLGFCDEGHRITDAANVTWAIEDWSGHNLGPIPVPYEIIGARHFFGGCVYTDFASQKPGVAFIKLSINDPSTGFSNFEKVFMVGWMQIQTPVVTGGGDVIAGDINCTVQVDLKVLYPKQLTDPFRVCPTGYDPRQRVTATVKGTIPLDANFTEWAFPASGPGSLVTPGQLTLPDDWNAWAQVAARTGNNPAPLGDHTTAAYVTNWDIHDTQASTADNHVFTGGTQCNPPEANAPGTTDTVDNCTFGGLVSPTWGNQHGGFSTVFGTQSRAGSSDGPFDPLYSNDTMLSDGTVDSGDAPMPAAQLDAVITENTGAPTDISGVGYLSPTDKSVVYSRDHLGTNAGHNFDSPFYHQWIPATYRPVSAGGSPYGAVQPTGIDGTADADGFGGFLVKGLYRNWDFAWEASYHPSAPSNCLEFQSLFANAVLHYRPLPYGDSSVSVYTDEHGEANVYFVPGLGFYFDNLNVIKNSNGGCDPKLVDVLGTSHIVITARYPYQPVTAADPSAFVDFKVHSKFQKTLTSYGKGPKGTDNDVDRIVLAHAQDIDGNPLQYEVVCWTSNDLGNGAFTAFPGSPAGGDILDMNGNIVTHIDYTWAQDHSFVNAGRFCTTTDSNGNTAIEFSNSKAGSVDIVANWVNEQVKRDILVTFGATAGNNGQLADSGPVSHIPTPAQVKAASTAFGAVGPVLVDANGKALKTKVIKSHKVTKALHKIRLARVVKPFHGKRMLQVRVNGKAGMVGLRITIKLGGKSHTFTRFVPANVQIAVPNLPIPVKTAKVTVSVIGG
jgi:hypothetical protein